MKMTLCPAYTILESGIEIECPLKSECARTVIIRVIDDIFDDMPYDFDDEYCHKFIWNGKERKV